MTEQVALAYGRAVVALERGHGHPSIRFASTTPEAGRATANAGPPMTPASAMPPRRWAGGPAASMREAAVAGRRGIRGERVPHAVEFVLGGGRNDHARGSACAENRRVGARDRRTSVTTGTGSAVAKADLDRVASRSADVVGQAQGVCSTRRGVDEVGGKAGVPSPEIVTGTSALASAPRAPGCRSPGAGSVCPTNATRAPRSAPPTCRPSRWRRRRGRARTSVAARRLKRRAGRNLYHRGTVGQLGRRHPRVLAAGGRGTWNTAEPARRAGQAARHRRLLR